MSLFSYLLAIFTVVFWLFRVIVTILFQLDIELFTTPIDMNTEIIILFLTLPCLILNSKRNIIGAAGYLALYAVYFGQAFYQTLISATAQGLNVVNTADIICNTLGVMLPVLTFFDILLNKNRDVGKMNKKADWFYKNEDYDREFDERADRNQYKL